MSKIDLIREWLEDHPSELKDIEYDLDHWDVRYELPWDFDEEFFEIFKDRMEVARAVCFGQMNWNDPYITLDIYGNVKTLNEYEFDDLIMSNIDDVAETLADLDDDIGNYINIPPELEAIIGIRSDNRRPKARKPAKKKTVKKKPAIKSRSIRKKPARLKAKPKAKRK